jgi:Metallo-beta-lactamase superfamily
MAVNEYLGKDGPAPTSGDLLKQLTAEGIAREEITNVVLTHAHPDHIGGSSIPAASPLFPMPSTCRKPNGISRLPTPTLNNPRPNNHVRRLVTSAQKNLPPLKGRIELFEGEKEVVRTCDPCTRAYPGPRRTGDFVVQRTIAASWGLCAASDASRTSCVA